MGADVARRVLVPRVLAPPAGPPGPRVPCILTGQSMGTSWTVTLALPGAISPASARAAIESVLARVVAEMSHWQADSDVSRFNRAPAGSW